MKLLSSLCCCGLLFLIPIPAYADLARSLSCYTQSDKHDVCQTVLIGAIDAIYGFNAACPDGNTSYGYLIAAWKRDLKKHEDRQKIPTVKSMEKTMTEHGLKCK